MRTGDGVVFADGRSAVEAVGVHRSGSLKGQAQFVGVDGGDDAGVGGESGVYSESSGKETARRRIRKR